MREKKWKDCPVCGSKNCMRQEKHLVERFHPKEYPPLDMENLEGCFCAQCGEGFWSLKSQRRITQLLTQHRAEYDATRIVAAELTSVQDAAKALKISVQGIHKMMNEGRLRYVMAGGRRLPIRKDLHALISAKPEGGAAKQPGFDFAARSWPHPFPPYRCFSRVY